MNGAHIHLLVNHAPLFALVFGLGLMAYGVLRTHPAVLRAAMVILVLAAITGLVAMKSGEEAEEVVEELNIVEKSIIHEHEEAAEWAAILGYVVGALALGGLVMGWKKETPKLLVYGTLGVGVVALLFMARAASLGGEIRHTEIRGDAMSRIVGGSPAVVPGATQQQEVPHTEGDDNDAR